jgi:hypothetical protein
MWMCQEYLFKIRNRSATRDCLDDSGDIIKAWKIIADNIKISGWESLGYHRLLQQISGLMKYVQFLDQGSKLYCNGYSIPA